MNPAVTVALACINKTSWKKVPFFIVSQYLGAFCASAMIYFVYYGKFVSLIVQNIDLALLYIINYMFGIDLKTMIKSLIFFIANIGR